MGSLIAPTGDANGFEPGLWQDFLPGDKRPADGDWLGARSSSMLGRAIRAAQYEPANEEESLINHVGQTVWLHEYRWQALTQDGHQIPKEWIGEPCVLEALEKLSVTPLCCYLVAGGIVLARHHEQYYRPKVIPPGQVLDGLLNFVGHDYGWALIGGHAVGRAAAQGLALLGAHDAGRKANDWILRRVDGEYVCSTWVGIGFDMRGIEIWRHPDPDRRDPGERPLRPRMQTPDDHMDAILWGHYDARGEWTIYHNAGVVPGM